MVGDMSSAHAYETTVRDQVRLWPGVLLVVVQWFAWAVLPLVSAEAALYSVIGGVAAGLFVLIWWLFFSRVPWSERVGTVALMVVALLATSRIVHQSIANGFQGMMLYLFAIPVLSLALVAGAVLGRRSAAA